jgi:hypothetical protein
LWWLGIIAALTAVDTSPDINRDAGGTLVARGALLPVARVIHELHHHGW